MIDQFVDCCSESQVLAFMIALQSSPKNTPWSPESTSWSLKPCTDLLGYGNQKQQQPLPTSPPIVNVALDCPTLQNTILFLHAPCFIPTKSMALKAIYQGYFATMRPGFSVPAINCYLKTTQATTMGHLDQTQKDLAHSRHT